MIPNAQQGSESPARAGRESEALRSQLEEERKRVAQVQRELEEQRSQLLQLKTQRPVEKLEEKGVLPGSPAGEQPVQGEVPGGG